MKVIALEEHFATPETMAVWGAMPPDARDVAIGFYTAGDMERRLTDLADERLSRMDAAGIDVAVLSLTTPSVGTLGPAEGVRLARATNDLLATTVRARPDRFGGFAALPLGNPAAAARELERAVRDLGLDGAILHGGPRDRPLDHPDLLPVFEAAAALRAPITLHPSSPPPSVRDAYYRGFGDATDALLATAGLGWHYEAGIGVLRLVLAGTFDRFPDLQVILGHWGEVVLFYLDRIGDVLPEGKTGLRRPVPDYFRTNVSVTPSGLLSQRYLRWVREVLGADRILWSADDPFVPQPEDAARRFLAASDLDDAERHAIAHGNWERMHAAIRR